MQKHKVNNLETAKALAGYWNRAYGVDTEIKQAIGGLWHEVWINEHWMEDKAARCREICDAFVQGRLSLALTAD